MNLMNCLPMCPELADMDTGTLREIRLRNGQHPLIRTSLGDVRGAAVLQGKDLLIAAQALTGHALSIYAPQLAQGFLPVPGGHRLGVCGRMFLENGQWKLCDLSSLCLRIAHSIPNAAQSIWPVIRDSSLLIIGPPGSGKTTLLRDVIRRHAQCGKQVCIADERGEIAACANGLPQLDVGGADVITLLDKSRALPLLLRSMAPDYLCTDELGHADEIRTLLDAHAAGVRLLCTVHGNSLQSLQNRPGFDALLKGKVFDAFALLTVPGAPIQCTLQGEQR